MVLHMADITESQFYEYDFNLRLFEHDYPRRFGRYELPEGNSFVFSWRSDIIHPSIAVCELSNITYIGVDEHLAAINASGIVLFSIPLTSLLFAIKSAGAFTIAVCEQQAIIFNADGSTKNTIDFSDIAEKFSINDNSLTISFMDGGHEHYNF
jgi:hypothetical protein